MDLTINKPIKDFLKKKFEEWYAGEISRQLDEGSRMTDIDLEPKLTSVKREGSLACQSCHLHSREPTDDSQRVSSIRYNCCN